ncbi:hypothetical protein HELRODRAFT_159083 [Helobdella robusta]|uniref:Uncharacterized protein n=1 Tax=Helobdella robusta TaxID=6412 RepID=T1ENK3_HELRO|nr:hypothetical protein HELRODRAFT_159083 [Helobdella robusta]ESO12527.1 hypothetical protein HELRODRAFT_159083 [Helobdella robusta]
MALQRGRNGERHAPKIDDAAKQISTKRKTKKEHENFYVGIKQKLSNSYELSSDNNKNIFQIGDFDDVNDPLENENDLVINNIITNHGRISLSDVNASNEERVEKWKNTSAANVPLRNEIMLAVIILSVLATAIFILAVILLRL